MAHLPMVLTDSRIVPGLPWSVVRIHSFEKALDGNAGWRHHGKYRESRKPVVVMVMEMEMEISRPPSPSAGHCHRL